MGVVESILGLGEEKTFTIGSGADGSSVDPVDLGANYRGIIVRCEDCSNIAADTSLTVRAAITGDGTVCDLYQITAPGTKWGNGETLPTSGTYHVLVDDAAGARRVRLVLGNNASGGAVVFKIRGAGKIT